MKRHGLLLAAVLYGLVCSSGCGQRAADIKIVLSEGSSSLKAEDTKEKAQAETSVHRTVETMAARPDRNASKTRIGPSVANINEQFVRIKDYIPEVQVDLKYAAADNFTGQKIYDFTDAYLRYGTMEKLKKAQEKARERGMVLKIWDAYRPVSAQFALWNACPDPTYVADPNGGHSSHSRGNTVDLTLVYENGTPVEMPTGFDDFSLLADRDYSDCNETAAQNARLLESIMEECGFEPYWGEWWHFSDAESYEVEEEFEP